MNEPTNSQIYSRLISLENMVRELTQDKDTQLRGWVTTQQALKTLPFNRSQILKRAREKGLLTKFAKSRPIKYDGREIMELKQRIMDGRYGFYGDDIWDNKLKTEGP